MVHNVIELSKMVSMKLNYDNVSVGRGSPQGFPRGSTGPSSVQDAVAARCVWCFWEPGSSTWRTMKDKWRFLRCFLILAWDVCHFIKKNVKKRDFSFISRHVEEPGSQKHHELACSSTCCVLTLFYVSCAQHFSKVMYLLPQTSWNRTQIRKI